MDKQKRSIFSCFWNFIGICWNGGHSKQEVITIIDDTPNEDELFHQRIVQEGSRWFPFGE